MTSPSGGPNARPAGTRTARVARLPYLNAAPFYRNWASLEEKSEGRWAPAMFVPRQLGLAAEAGEVDAGLMALADLIRLESIFEPLLVPSAGAPVTFGISNHERVDSVLLFLNSRSLSRGEPVEPRTGDPSAGAFERAEHPSRDPGRTLTPREVNALRGARIGITGETSTSFRLLRLLLEARYGVKDALYERLDLGAAATSLDRLDAALVIGDLALRWKHRPPEGLFLAMDLASGWHEWQGLPFVFARWGVRRDLPAELKLWLGRFLEDALNESAGGFEALLDGLPGDLGPKAGLVDYLNTFTYRLGTDELKAAALFRELLERHRILCSGE